MTEVCFRICRMFVLCAMLIASLTSANANEVSNQYELFIEGLVAHQYMGPFGGGKFKPEFSYDGIPEKLKKIVVLPANSKIVGNLISGDSINMVFVSELPPENIKRTMEETAVAAGWRIPAAPDMPRPVGFRPYSESNLIDSLLCDKEGETFIRLFIYPRADKNIVSLKYFEGRERTPCKQTPPMRMPRHSAPIPNLMNPKNIAATIGHTSGGNSSWTTNVSLKSGDVSMIVEHYAAQLSKKSWIPVEKKDGNNIAWRLWHFNDDNDLTWTGMMLVKKSANHENTSDARLWVFQ